MAVASPQFTGVWTQTSMSETDVEEKNVKYNENTQAYLVRVLVNRKYEYVYEKVTDADNIDANGDKLAIENLNDPIGGKPWEKRLESLTVIYNPELGTAVCKKVMTKEEQSWSKKTDEPINLSKLRIV